MSADDYPTLNWKDPQPDERHKAMAQRLAEHWWDKEGGREAYDAEAERVARQQLDELLYGVSTEKRSWSTDADA